MKDKITIQTGAIPTVEEIEAATFLVLQGKTVRFLAPSQRKNDRTPDIEMDGLKWEIKSPIGKSTNTIKRSFKTAIKQSKYLIFDLRHSKIPDKRNVERLNKEFNDIKSVKHLIIITKSKKLLEYTK
jgi:hypothetical protein